MYHGGLLHAFVFLYNIVSGQLALLLLINNKYNGINLGLGYGKARYTHYPCSRLRVVCTGL